jgi:Uroporphyrinogen decarboxylase (URO-D)
MAEDVMSPEERMVATVNLRPVDRIACAPMIDQYAGQFVGITNKEFMWDWDKAQECLDAVKKTHPIWDGLGFMQHWRHAPVAQTAGMARSRQPGKELADNDSYQIVEYEAMKREDYSLLREKGFLEYRLTFLERVHDKSRAEVLSGLDLLAKLRQAEIEATYRRGQAPVWGSLPGSLPFDMLSIMRSMEGLFKDMYKIGSDLDELLWIVCNAVITNAERVADATGVRRVFVGGVRCSGQFISTKNFERFALPHLKAIVEKLSEKGITVVCHFDTNWNKNLEYFLQLPKARFVLQLDSATDIFKAHDILKGHCSIMGDVSAALFTVGTPTEVDDYAKKLIGAFKNGEGLIYSSGCTLPMNAKHENVKAFFDAVEKYGRFN